MNIRKIASPPFPRNLPYCCPCLFRNDGSNLSRREEYVFGRHKPRRTAPDDIFLPESAGASSKTPATPAAIVSALEACDRCRCSRIGGIFHTERLLKYIGVRLMWKVFCGKQSFKHNPCSWVCAERAGTPGAGIQDAGGKTPVCRNRRFMNQGFTEQEPEFRLESWLQGHMESGFKGVGIRNLGPHGIKIQGCRKQGH